MSVISSDIRKLCDEILAAKAAPVSAPVSDVTEKTAGAEPTDASALIEAIDQALEGTVTPAIEGKIALAKLLRIGDILAQGER